MGRAAAPSGVLMRRALVFGASGQIGRPLLARLQADGWEVTALSRSTHTDMDDLHWMQGEFAQLPELPRSVDVVFSCGPLDLFSHWYQTATIEAARVVAFSSTSVQIKHDSSDPAERNVAQRLREGEQRIFAAASSRGVGVTVLRPTLVYGAARDQTLTRIADMARRWGRFALPRHAHGLRQPVHVEDLANAALCAAGRAQCVGKTYALPGGETLRYREMVLRVLATLQPQPRLIELPGPLFELILQLAQRRGIATGLGQAAVARMRADLIFDVAPAWRDLDYAPRLFQPGPGTFERKPGIRI